jgi:hypothetical protein
MGVLVRKATRSWQRTFAAVAAATMLLTGCGKLREKADAKFGDQHFKTAISLIELYRVRHGTYPANLSELDFSGDWDAIALNSVTYRRLDNGYELNITRGWVGKPTLAYPAAFWKGLGLRATNVGRLPPAT